MKSLFQADSIKWEILAGYANIVFALSSGGILGHRIYTGDQYGIVVKF